MAGIDAASGPQILELFSKSLPITIYDTKCARWPQPQCRALEPLRGAVRLLRGG